MKKVSKAAVKSGRRTPGRKVASGPGKVGSRTRRPARTTTQKTTSPRRPAAAKVPAAAPAVPAAAPADAAVPVAPAAVPAPAVPATPAATETATPAPQTPGSKT